MQELRLVAVAEDGSYVVLAAPGRSNRFTLPVDDRLRVVARGQFSRLAQYEIEVERPLRPKEIQDRIRAGETAEEIADAAGVPIERVRRFEGPVLAERAYRAQEARRASLRPPGGSGPGRGLGDIVSERLRELGLDPEEADWDSRKNSDGTWQVKLAFSPGSRAQVAEWVFDPRRKQVAPADDTAARLSEPDAELPSPEPLPVPGTTATVTPIGSRLATAAALAEPEARRQPEGLRQAEARRQPEAPAAPAPGFEAEEAAPPPPPQTPPRERPARKAAGGRSRRSSVPSWDEIMFGTSRRND